MISKLSIKITKSWEIPLAYCFLVDIQEKNGEHFVDDFHWVKNSALVNLGTDDNPTWITLEKNQFTQKEIANTAARHFLRLAGRIKRGDPYPAFTFTKKRGKDALDNSLSKRTLELLDDEYEIEGDWPDKPIAPKAPLTTVATLSASYDADVTSGNTRTTGGTTLRLYRDDDTPIYYRVATKFDISSLPSPVTVTNSQLITNVTTANANATVNVQAYNLNGQADPAADTAANMYTRCGDDASPYLSANTFAQSTGVKTLDLTTACDTDIQNARAAGTIFSLGLNRADSTAGVTAVALEAVENTGTNEPKLEVTYTTGTTYYQTLSAASAHTSTLAKIKTAPRTLSATSAHSATLSKVMTALRTLTATSTHSVTLSKVKTAFKTLSATASHLATLSYGRIFLKTLSVVASHVASLSKVQTAVRTLSTTTSHVATLSKVKTAIRTLSATASHTASLSKVKTAYRTLAVTVSHVVTILQDIIPKVGAITLVTLRSRLNNMLNDTTSIWSDTVKNQAINSGIGLLYPFSYLPKDDTSQVTDTETPTLLYTVPSDCLQLCQVYIYSRNIHWMEKLMLVQPWRWLRATNQVEITQIQCYRNNKTIQLVYEAAHPQLVNDTDIFRPRQRQQAIIEAVLHYAMILCYKVKERQSIGEIDFKDYIDLTSQEYKMYLDMLRRAAIPRVPVING